MKWIGFMALILSSLAYIRTDFFSPASIAAPLVHTVTEKPSSSVVQALSQPYRYLGKGRQCYVYLSQDAQTVIKFFNVKYLTLPWYGKWIDGEKKKRAQRQKYYRESYPLALDGDSEILYLHLAKSEKLLPSLSILDRASRLFHIDLNRTPFVLQRKGDSFYEALQSLYEREGEEGFQEGIHQFVSLIARRIEKKIADADHDVEHNFGLIEGKVFHLDPGRLFFEERLWEPDLLAKEWWSATHRFRNWLLKMHPESVSFLDGAIEAEKNKRSDISCQIISS